MMKLNQSFSYALVISSGILIRLILFLSSYQKTITDRVEVSTPLTGWKRAIEAIHLLDKNVSPYSGELFHESPLFLYFYKTINKLDQHLLFSLFVLLDYLTAILISLIAFNHLEHLLSLERPRFLEFKDSPKDLKLIEISETKLKNVTFRVFTFYFLCPYAIAACVGQSTGVFSNFLITLTLLFATYNQRFLSSFFIALLSFNSFHNLVLLLPIALIIELKRNFSCSDCKFDTINFEFKLKRSNNDLIKEKVDGQDDKLIKNIVFSVYSILATCLISLFCGVFFLLTSYFLMDQSFEFVNSTFVFVSTIPELTPNVGLFWYFLTEMFEHFQDFFLWTIQINAFIFVIPLAISLKKNPYFYLFVSLIFLSIFKPYPSVSDFSICLAFIPQWTHLFNLLKHGFIISACFVVCSIIAPIMWYLWIVIGTGNANFYFGITLAFNAGQIFLFTNSLFAYAKRQFYLEHGSMKDANNKQLDLTLVYKYD